MSTAQAFWLGWAACLAFCAIVFLCVDISYRRRRTIFDRSPWTLLEVFRTIQLQLPCKSAWGAPGWLARSACRFRLATSNRMWNDWKRRGLL